MNEQPEFFRVEHVHGITRIDPAPAARNSVRDTSLEAYWQHIESGAAKTQQDRIYMALRVSGGITRTELSRGMGIPINAVCGRVNELIKLGAVRETAKRKCRVTGSNAWVLETTGGQR